LEVKGHSSGLRVMEGEQKQRVTDGGKRAHRPLLPAAAMCWLLHDVMMPT
jgi:hypothetical protein